MYNVFYARLLTLTVYGRAHACTPHVCIAGVFQNTTGEVSDYYSTDITPAGWTFSIWGVIYAWQILWLAYSLSTLCRQTNYGYVYRNPNHQPAIFYLIYVINMAANVCWLLLWDRFMAQYSLIAIVLMALTLVVMLVISYVRLYYATPIFLREDCRVDVWMTRILTQNGLAIYATWVIIAALINLDVVLVYYADVNQSVGGTICLALLFLLICSWFFLDNFVCDRFVRYMLTPYFVVVFALSGSVDQNYDPDSSTSVLSVCLLAISACLLMIKLVLMIYRALKSPLFDWSQQSIFTQQANYGTLGPDSHKDAMRDYEETSQ